MRTLMIFNIDNSVHCAMLTHNDDYDTCDEDVVNALRNELEADDSNVYFIEMPDEEFRPVVTDQFGDEAPMQFLDKR